MIFTFRSGGQTGVDRGVFDAFLDYVRNNESIKDINREESLLTVEFKNGNVRILTGWCPQGRIADDGKLDSKYPFKETPSSEYMERTEWNVRDAEATLIILPSSTYNTKLGGTGFTIKMVEKYGKLWEKIYLDQNTVDNIKQLLDWIKNNKIDHLNLAGPRESKFPGIHESTYKFIYSLLEKMENNQ
ncbi:putative molybdenum carrier-domain-containing protein [Gigaspora rosea]|uniref:Putative molybdenum carrier-domain-containing protein n=1 Tax=Gigaspora rosea TaxID=44941 RepID=A0A397VIG8_9GLOM|nr:putative molybdenum carrier-domain-containing protein [Gigaspora rosea]